VGSIIYPQAMVLDKQEVIEAQWFSLDQLPNHIAFDHRQMIEDYYGRSSNR
jgi:NADH pyrophosphatase NudC (nudix superfamily)